MAPSILGWVLGGGLGQARVRIVGLCQGSDVLHEDRKDASLWRTHCQPLDMLVVHRAGQVKRQSARSSCRPVAQGYLLPPLRSTTAGAAARTTGLTLPMALENNLGDVHVTGSGSINTDLQEHSSNARTTAIRRDSTVDSRTMTLAVIVRRERIFPK